MANQTRDKQTGRYSYEGQWDRLCVCGHTLGESHGAEPPHSCGLYGTGLNNCECKKFKPAQEAKE